MRDQIGVFPSSSHLSPSLRRGIFSATITKEIHLQSRSKI
uniref:Uncharacterized protein n=1 Tax=Lepeophtheirus salmonis TaxID=72036 RepID=A0A0K2V8P8_LEPSM